VGVEVALPVTPEMLVSAYPPCHGLDEEASQLERQAAAIVQQQAAKAQPAAPSEQTSTLALRSGEE
jgi:hypothetical protein